MSPIYGNKMNCCIICYKQTSHEEKREDLQRRFFLLLKRYVNYGAGLLDNEMGSCQDCCMLMDSFCQLYHNMKLAELQLNKKLWTITNIMKSGGKVKSRIKELRDDMLECKGSDGAQEWMDLIINFKKHLVKKCSAKLVGSTPKLIIPKYIGSSANTESHGEELNTLDSRVTLEAPITQIIIPIQLHNESQNNFSTEGIHNELLPVIVSTITTSTIENEKTALEMQEEAEDVHDWNTPNSVSSPVDLETSIYAEHKSTFSNLTCEDEYSSDGELNEINQMEKCEEEILIPKLEILSKRIGIPNSFGSPAHAASDFLHDFDGDDFEHSQSLNGHDQLENPAVPVISNVIETKIENTPMAFPGTKKRKRRTVFRTRQAFNISTRISQRLRPFKCSTCKKSFSRHVLRRRIDAVHLRHKPFNCSNCEESTATSYLPRSQKAVPTPHDSKTHGINLHAEQNLFQCRICKKKFKYRDQLARHFCSVHLKQRHACKVPGCDKSYSQANNLTRHCKREHPDIAQPQKRKPRKFMEYSKILENGVITFKCSTCLKIFSNPGNLRRHIKIVHLRLKPYKCDICDKSFATHRQLKLHKLTPHISKPEGLNSKTFPCGECGKVVKKLKSFQIYAGKKFQCSICEKEFNHRHNLKNHISGVHEKKRFYCKVPGCDKSFSQAGSRHNHFKLAHPDFNKGISNNILPVIGPPTTATTAICTIEKKQRELEEQLAGENSQSRVLLNPNSSLVELPSAIQISSYPDLGEGEECGLIEGEKHLRNPNPEDFQNDKSSKSHSEIPSENHAIPVIAEITNGTKLEGGALTFLCEKCGHAFGTLQFLKTHEDNVHAESCQCNTRRMNFKHPSSLKTQISSVHEKKRHYCKIPGCDKNYSWYRGLSNHCKVEHPDFTILGELKPDKIEQIIYKCPTCLRKFKEASHLQRHINMVHLRLKPHKCDMCDKSFATKPLLMAHRVIPHNPKPHIPNFETIPCGKCDKKFNNHQSLKAHEYNVHGKRTFKFPCSICKKQFRYCAQLKIHFSSVHQKQKHSCEIVGCNKCYYSRSALVIHYKLKHPDFTMPSLLSNKIMKYSEKLENGENVYECKLCSDKFKTVDIVKKHIVVVHRLKKFLCVHCGYTSASKLNVDKHNQHIHNINPNENEAQKK